jgi:ankyrin repeat protein
VNLTDWGEGWSALMFAGGEGHVEVITTLLAAGADADLNDTDGDTALTFAQRNGHQEAATLLQAAMKK